jgi:hypothetical protein
MSTVISWSYRRKWAATLVVSAFTFIAPVSSTMVAPAAQQVAEYFGITNNVMIAMTISIFVLAYGKPSCRPSIQLESLNNLGIVALAPFILAPLSEIYGRSVVLLVSNMWYLGAPLSFDTS